MTGRASVASRASRFGAAPPRSIAEAGYCPGSQYPRLRRQSKPDRPAAAPPTTSPAPRVACSCATASRAGRTISLHPNKRPVSPAASRDVGGARLRRVRPALAGLQRLRLRRSHPPGPLNCSMSHPEVLADWRDRVRYLLVDEIPDTNLCASIWSASSPPTAAPSPWSATTTSPSTAGAAPIPRISRACRRTIRP